MDADSCLDRTTDVTADELRQTDLMTYVFETEVLFAVRKFASVRILALLGSTLLFFGLKVTQTRHEIVKLSILSLLPALAEIFNQG